MTIPDKTAEEIAFEIKKLSCFCNCEKPMPRCTVDVERIAQAIRQAHDDAIEKSAQAADRLCNGFHSPHEYSDDVAEAIRKLKHQTKGGA